MTMDTNKDGEDSARRIPRRRVLEIMAAGSSVSLAGCAGDRGDSTPTEPSGDGNDDNDGSDNTPEQMVDATWHHRTSAVPSDITWNPMAAGGTDWYTQSLIHGFGSALDRKDPLAYVPLVAKNWELDGKTFTIEMNDQFNWHDGKSVTADHYALQYELVSYMGFGKHYAALSSLDGLPEATDKYTLEMTLNKKMNPAMFVPKNFGEPIWYEPDFFLPFVEKFRDASSESEKKDIRVQVSEAEMEKPIGCGPLKYVAADQQKLETEYFDGYPFEAVQQQFTDAIGHDITGYGRPNFDKVNVESIPGDTKMTQEIVANSVDGGVSPVVPKDQLPEGMYITKEPTLHGSGFKWNFWDWGKTPGLDIWKDVNVRKAFAHAINRRAAGLALAQGIDTAVTDSIMSGMLKSQENGWFDDAFINKLDPYEHDYDKAAEYLRKAGCTKEDGKWYKPDGDLFEVKMKTGAGVSSYVNAFQIVSSNLSELGLTPKFVTEPNSVFFAKAPNDAGMQMTTTYWGGAAKHPYFAFDWMYRREYAKKKGSTERDWYLPGDEKLEVPPIGQPDSSERKTIDPWSKLQELSVTIDKEAQTEIIKELAWATNWWVPKITCNENYVTSAISTQGWKVPPEGNTVYGTHPAFSMIHHLGVIDADS